MTNKRVQHTWINRLDRPRRTVWLFWPGASNLGDMVINPHRCAPGLARHIQRYVLANPDGVEGRERPNKRFRRTGLLLDPGGAVMQQDGPHWVHIGLNAGGHPYYIECAFFLLHNVVSMLESMHEKRYLDIDTVRCLSFPRAVCVMRPEERDQALELLRPLHDKSLQQAIVARQELKASPGGGAVFIPNLPPLMAPADS